MLYNLAGKSKYMETAGKITIAAAFSGVLIFAFVFLFNAGKTELLKVEAQGAATTTITVLNTPPQWLDDAVEEFESSTSTPTNSGNTVSWVARAENTGGAPYFLIVCSTSATPTPTAAASLLVLGSAPPRCLSGITWGVSTATADSAPARVATTTTQVGAFAGEVLPWFAWVCDDDPVNPRCNNLPKQGLNATNSSPFHVNFRPIFTAATSTSPVNPGGLLTFTSSSSDPNSVRGPDNILLYVCNGNDFVPATRTCASGVLGSTTGSVTSNASASFTLPPVVQDDVYNAYVFLIDQYNHTATGTIQASNPGYRVNNVAPTVNGGSISINGGNNLVLTQQLAQTTGFTLDFETSDANSCVAVPSGNEMRGYTVSLFRSSLGTTTCTGLPGSYNPNNCYPSSVPTSTVWNLSCTASSTSCSGISDATINWSCTFPLWHIADPTDVIAQFAADNWVAAIAGVDNNNATGTATLSTIGQELLSYPAIDLGNSQIPYGSLEPGFNTGTLNASATVRVLGNTGLNANVLGTSMCPTFSLVSPCAVNASSTIPIDRQEFATSSVAYNSGTDLASTTQLIDLRIPKSTSTTTPNSRLSYWGIEVPIAITVAGAYSGLNTFFAVTSPSGQW
jgi:hypothetical protein